MSAKFRKPHEGTYDFRDSKCIEADCFTPGTYATRGASASGSRATGHETKCCVRRAYHGCPSDVVHLPELGKTRRAEGWKKA